MKFDRKLLSLLLAVIMVMGMILPASAAAQREEANYGEAKYYDIAVDAMSRMLAFHDGVVIAADGVSHLYGLITSSGVVRVDFQYDKIEFLANNLFKAAKDGLYGIIDSDGEILEPIEHGRFDIAAVTAYYEFAGGGYQETPCIRIDDNYYTADRDLEPVDWHEVSGSELAEELGYDYIYEIYDYYHSNPTYYFAQNYYNSYAAYILDENYDVVISSTDWIEWGWNESGQIRFYTPDALYDEYGIDVLFDAEAWGLTFESGKHSALGSDFLLVYDSREAYGAVDMDGNLFIDCKYDNIGNGNQQGYIAAVNSNGSDIYQLDSGNGPVETFEDKYIATEVYYRHLVFNTSDNSSYGMMDINETELFSQQYKRVDSDGNGNLLVGKSGYNWGLRDLEGNVIFADDIYENISYLGGNYYKLRNISDSRYGISSVSGTNTTVVIPATCPEMRVFTTSFVELYDAATSKYKIVDLADPSIPVVRESDVYIDLFTTYSVQSTASSPNLNLYLHLPFCIVDAVNGEYATVYAQPSTGKTDIELAHWTSGINKNDMFAYWDEDDGLYGFGILGDVGLPEDSMLEPAVLYVPYSDTLDVADAVSYELDTGAILPDGLDLVDLTTGEISGVPMQSGTFEFKVKVTLTDGSVITQLCSLTVLSNSDSNVVKHENDYPIIENVGEEESANKFVVTGYNDEVLVIDGPYNEFYRLLIDGVEKTPGVHYTVRAGSTIITIRAQTFSEIGTGTHTIAAEFQGINGEVKQASQNYTMTSDYTGGNIGTETSRPSSSSTSYRITVPEIPNCTVTVFPTAAAANSQVTLTVRPNTGYKLTSLTVSGPNGKQITLTQIGEYQYTFTMPSGSVSISAQVERLAPAGSTPFVDMQESDWFYSSVATAYERGWMIGTSTDTFGPHIKTSRGMFVTLLHRIVGEPDAEDNTYFSDVPSGQYYSSAVAWAAEKGIITSRGDGQFGPSDDLTREQLVIMLYNYAKLTGMDTAARSALTQFTDLAQLSSDAQEAMSWGNAIGLINGKGNGILDPTGTASRAELAALIVRFAALAEME